MTLPASSAPHGRFAHFGEFYPYYLSEHRNRTCRRLHFVGTLLVIALPVVSLLSGSPWWLCAMPVAGYGFAWAGHFIFENNRPATFSHPWYSLAGDFVLFRDMLAGRIKF